MMASEPSAAVAAPSSTAGKMRKIHGTARTIASSSA
jgi:hypothetical protein